MEQKYELNTHDVLAMVEQQLATPEFDDSFDYTPYQEFGPDGKHVWSNLMSGHWEWKEAVHFFYAFLPTLKSRLSLALEIYYSTYTTFSKQAPKKEASFPKILLPALP